MSWLAALALYLLLCLLGGWLFGGAARLGGDA